MRAAPAWSGTVGDSVRPPANGYRALGHLFRVACDDPRLAERISSLLAPLLATEDAGSDPAAERIGVTRAPDGVTFVAEGSELHLATDGQLIDHLLWYVNSRAVDDVSFRGTGFHAAAVQRDGATLLCPAPSGAGKSTLAAGMVRDGWSYLSDEAVELDGRTGDLVPYPKPITLDPGAHHLFPEVQTALTDTVSWYVDPRAWGERPDYSPAAPSAVVLPWFRAGSDLEVDVVPPGQAFMALAPTTFLFRRAPERNMHVLGRLVRSTPVFRLTYGSLDQCREGVAHILHGAPA
jgi:hypothetical protein